jgi:hypothetical protein
MNGMAKLGKGPGTATIYDAAESFVVCHLPFHDGPSWSHPGPWFEWLGGQPRPQHESFGMRVSRRDAENEGVIAPSMVAGLGTRNVNREPCQDRKSGNVGDGGEEATAIDFRGPLVIASRHATSSRHAGQAR